MGIRILVADDHHVVRRGLVFFLKTQKEIEIIGEAGNGEEAVKMAQQLKPELILMDLSMPVMNGIEATKEIKRLLPNVKIMILTSFSDSDNVIPAIEAGASGYQLKDIQPDELVRTIKQLMRGENQLHPKATTHLLSHLTTLNREEKRPFDD